MEGFHVIVAVDRGLEDTGRRVNVDVLAASRLDAAIIAEGFVNNALAGNEYAHASAINQITSNRPGPSMAMAA